MGGASVGGWQAAKLARLNPGGADSDKLAPGVYRGCRRVWRVSKGCGDQLFDDSI